MPRETALQKAQRELRQTREELDGVRGWGERLADEVRHLHDRCSFLYAQAMRYAEELANNRLCPGIDLAHPRYNFDHKYPHGVPHEMPADSPWRRAGH